MMTSSGAGSAAGGGNVGAAPEHSLAGRGVGQSYWSLNLGRFQSRAEKR